MNNIMVCSYWMDRYTPENRLLITYEGLTDDVIGAEVTKGLSLFLGQAKGVTTIHPDSVPCIWRAVVKNEPPAQQAAQIMKLQSLAVNQPPGVHQQQQQQPLQQGTTLVVQPQQTANIAQLNLSNNAAIAQPTSQSIEQKQQPPLEQQQDLDSDSDSLDDLLREMEKKLADGKKLLQQQEPNGRRLLRTTQQQKHPTDHYRHRRLDPGHHNSQRKGPDVPRPYTPEQLDKMMKMLTEVALRYQNVDARLYHIMMGYYEQVRVARAELLGPEGGGGAVPPPPGGFY